MSQSVPHLPAFALFGALLSAAGLPIYIHAPKFYVDEFGVSLVTLAAVLVGLRLLDVVQDPLLGRLSDALRAYRSAAVAIATLVMAAAMVGLFAVTPPIPALWWFAAMLTLVFSTFSFLTICFYAQGVAAANSLPDKGHLRLARWRETGALLGVCSAAVAPTVLGLVMERPFAGFAASFAVLAGAALLFMRREWRGAAGLPSAGLLTILNDAPARRLLLLALVNAAPVAVSSTLFLFFVEARLEAPGFGGVFLVVFFLSAALSSPFWSLAAERFGVKPVLLLAMVMAICAFGCAVTLGPGDTVLFALICVASGATMGADLTLLPAVFARRMAVISPAASQGFGLWSFVSKLTLAVAVLLLPVLELAGFQSGAEAHPASALQMLSWLYAGVPCALKLIAVALLAATSLQET